MDLQSVLEIIKDGLVGYDINFPEWTGLAQRTAALYGIDDPLELLEQYIICPFLNGFCMHLKQSTYATSTSTMCSVLGINHLSTNAQ